MYSENMTEKILENSPPPPSPPPEPSPRKKKLTERFFSIIDRNFQTKLFHRAPVSTPFSIICLLTFRIEFIDANQVLDMRICIRFR